MTNNAPQSKCRQTAANDSTLRASEGTKEGIKVITGKVSEKVDSVVRKIKIALMILMMQRVTGALPLSCI